MAVDVTPCFVPDHLFCSCAASVVAVVLRRRTAQVEFVVVACEPEAGIVTVHTLIFNEGPALRAEDLRRRQEEEDAAMARQLQAQEEAASRPPIFRGMGGMQMRPMQMAAQSPEELRMRLATVLQMMAPNDPHRAIVARLYEQLGQLPPGAVLHNADRGMMSIMRAAVAQPEQNRGASQADIEALPTRIFHAPASASGSGAAAASSSTGGGDADESTKERFTCMVSGQGNREAGHEMERGACARLAGRHTR